MFREYCYFIDTLIEEKLEILFKNCPPNRYSGAHTVIASHHLNLIFTHTHKTSCSKKKEGNVIINHPESFT